MVQRSVALLEDIMSGIAFMMRWLVGATPKQVQRRMRRKGLL